LEDLSMPATDQDLTPAERLREIASILASGILRLRTLPESTASGPESSPEKSRESRKKSLDAFPPPSPDVPAG
jgi:hypothetical protein